MAIALTLFLSSCAPVGSPTTTNCPSSEKASVMAVADKELTLADAGSTSYAIIQAESPSQAEQTAATELATYLGKSTGAAFKTLKENQPGKPAKAIYVGWTKFAAAHGVGTAKLGAEEWVIKTIGDDLIITGGRPRGTVNGVFEFLETAVGVHMFDPFSELIPMHRTLTVKALDIRSKPAFIVHNIYSPYAHFAPDAPGKAEHFYIFNKNDHWYRPAYGIANKTGSPGDCHTFGQYIHPNNYAAAHPEYFAMNAKGERVTDAKGEKAAWFDLCLSNPDVRKIIVEKLRGHIEADRKKAAAMGLPPPFVYSVDQNDCVEHSCQCPNCKAISDREEAESGLMIDFINAVADNIKKDYPDVLVQTFAYNYTLKAPKSLKPRDNVMIRWCDNYSQSELFRPLTHEYNKEMRDLFEPWARMAKNMAVWDYWRLYKPHAPGFYAPFSNISCLKPDLEYFQKNNVKSMFIENEDFSFMSDDHGADDFQNFLPLRLWLGLKLLQDPKADAEKLLDTFFNGYYGGAASKMREFLSYIEKRQDVCQQKLISLDREDYFKAYLDVDFLVAAQKLLDEAEAACGADTLPLARVRRERIPVDSALLHLEPALRRTYCAHGEPFPFDRAQVLARYAANWNTYLDTYMSAKAKEKAKPFVEKRIDYLRTMPMISVGSIRHAALPANDAQIHVDGVLDEVAWSAATPLFLTPFEKLQQGLKVKTAVRLLWSKQKLYVAYECFDNRIQDMKYRKRNKDDMESWLDSSIEVFLNPSGDRRNYFQFIVNPSGALADFAIKTIEGQKDLDASWDSGAEVAVKINAGSWVVEMAIPFKPMNFEGRENSTVVANFCRSRYLKSDGTATQLQTWSPLLTRGFHDLEKFGTVRLAKDGDVSLTSFEGPEDTPVFTPHGGCDISFSKENVSDGLTSLRLLFKPASGDQGCLINAGERKDWSAYKELKADVFVEKPEQAGAIICLNADKPFYQWHGLKSGWNKDLTLIDLPRAAQKIDLTQIKNFYFYLGSTQNEHAVFIDNIRFVKR